MLEETDERNTKGEKDWGEERETSACKSVSFDVNGRQRGNCLLTCKVHNVRYTKTPISPLSTSALSHFLPRPQSQSITIKVCQWTWTGTLPCGQFALSIDLFTSAINVGTLLYAPLSPPLTGVCKCRHPLARQYISIYRMRCTFPYLIIARSVCL